MPRLARRPLVESVEQRLMMAVDVTLNPAITHQTMDGFGTAMMAFKAEANTIQQTSAFTNLYYKELGASMMRMDVCVESSRGPDGNLGTPITFGEDLQANIKLLQMDFNEIQRYAAVAKAGMTNKIDDFKLIASVWTPPHWMKGDELDPLTGQKTGYTPTIAGGGNDTCRGTLKDTPENLTQFGRYVAAYVAGFQQKYGVPIYALSIQNELAFSEPYNSCVYTPALYVKALKTVRSALDHYGLQAVKIQGPEDIGLGLTNTIRPMVRMFKYIDAVRKDPVAMEALDIYSDHGYASNDAQTTGREPNLWQQYFNGRPAAQYDSDNFVGVKNDGKSHWITETGGHVQTWSSSMAMVGNVFDAINYSDLSAYVYWQTSVGSVDSTAALTKNTDSTTNKFTAARHFYRYVRPGAVRIEATPNVPFGVTVSAFKQAAQKTLTTVIGNYGTTEQTITLDLGGLGVSSFTIDKLSSENSLWKDAGTIRVSNGVATFVMPPKSLRTIQGAIGNVEPPPPAQTGGITGLVYTDANANRVRDANEARVIGRTIYLDTDNDGVFDNGETSTTTNSEGRFTFNNLPAGSYKVRLVRVNEQQTTPTNNGAFATNVVAGQLNDSPSFGVIANNQVSYVEGSVFRDTNKNGAKESNEETLNGRTVYIDSNNNGALDDGERTSIVTNGIFSFNLLLAGTYKLREIVPSGETQTKPANGEPITLVLTSGQTSFGNLFGVAINDVTPPPATGVIQGIVFRDTNKNGTREDGEEYLSGRTVYIDTNNNGVLDNGERSVLSNPKFRFEQVSAGTYKIRQVVPSGEVQTTPANNEPITVTIVGGGIYEEGLFGVVANEVIPPPATGVIRGVVFRDTNKNGVKDSGEEVLNGRTVYIDVNNNGALDGDDRSTVTAGGSYTFDGLAGGTYKIREVVPSGETQTKPANGEPITVTIGGDGVSEGNLFGVAINTVTPPAGKARVSGVVFRDDNGNGVRDSGEAGIAGRTVWIETDNDGVLDSGEKTFSTPASGEYAFADLAPGTYRVQVVAGSFRKTAPASGYYLLNLTAGQTLGSQNFGLTERVKVGGTVFLDTNKNSKQDSGESRLSNWRVFIDANGNGKWDSTERNVLTPASGEWTIDGLLAGTFKVRLEVKSGYAATTTNPVSVTLGGGQTKTGIGFGARKL